MHHHVEKGTWYLFALKGTWYLFLLIFFGCVAHQPPQPWSEAAIETPVMDTGERATLIEGLRQQIGYAEKPGNDSSHLDGYRRLLAYLEANETLQGLNQWLNENFEVRRSPGADFLVTSYYLPELKAAKEASADYKFPIYAVPDDLVRVKLEDFLKDEHREFAGKVVERRLTPYETREQIDFNAEISKRLTPIAWMRNEIDRYLLHLEGSGRLSWPDGTMSIAGYAGNNGYPFVALGKLLIDDGVLKRKQVTMPAILDFFKKHPERWREYAKRMPRYIFFQLTDRVVGTTQTPLIPLRSIAVDPKIFPLGRVGYLRTRQPIFDEKQRVVEWRPMNLIVFAQDTGGGIKGRHIDLYWGAGDAAGLAAGYMKEEGELFMLVPKALTPNKQ